MDQNSPIASASRRVKKKVVSVETEKKKNLGFDLTAPKKLDFRRHSVASSTNLIKSKGTEALFSPAYRAGVSGTMRKSCSKKNPQKKPRAKSVIVLSPTAKKKNLSKPDTSSQKLEVPASALLVDNEKKDDEKKEEDEKKDDEKKEEDEKKDDEKKEEDEKDDHFQKIYDSYEQKDEGDDYDDEDEGDGEYDYEEAFDPFIFIKNLGPLPEEMKKRKSPVPKKKSDAPKITLALDLDETLVHCSVTPIENPEITFPVEFNGIEYTVYVRTRPHLVEFLTQVSQWFELILFTASQPVYANKLMDILDPGRKYIPYRIFRDSCVCTDGNYLKDLHILGRDLQYTAIVDNSVQAFGYQLNNGIPIESWFDDPDDTELKKMLDFLKVLKDADDVRPIIRDAYRIEEFVNTL